MKKLTIILSTLFILFGISSCATVKEIPSDLTANQLIQLGQKAFEAKNYKACEQYFLATIQRFGTNTNTYIEARYELGHLYITTKQYKKAYHIFKEILAMYEYSYDLPGAYKKLSLIGLNKIPSDILESLENPQQEPEVQPATTEAETYEDSEYSDFTEEQVDQTKTDNTYSESETEEVFESDSSTEQTFEIEE
jgi:tetratricopeptide (TPR) repeat protein